MRIPNKKTGIVVDEIYIKVKCLECGHTFNVKMRGSVTIKNCHCSNGTSIFNLTPTKGYVNVDTVFKGINYTPQQVEPEGYSIGQDTE